MEYAGGCPWSGFEPAVLQFCEESLCAWIRQPANTWSNLAYIIVGVLILARSKDRSRAIRSLGWLAVAIGITSFIYHASGTFLAEVLDLGSMYLFSGMILVLNLVRAEMVDARSWFRTYLVVILASMLVLVTVRILGTAVFGVHIVAASFLEFIIRRRKLDHTHMAKGARVKYRTFAYACGLFLLAYIIWLTDYHRIVCVPDSHIIQGHAIWHVLTALAFFQFYRFYQQLDRAFERYT